MIDPSGYVYDLRANDPTRLLLKIGWSTQPVDRIRVVQTGCPMETSAFLQDWIVTIPAVERFLHRLFAEWSAREGSE